MNVLLRRAPMRFARQCRQRVGGARTQVLLSFLYFPQQLQVRSMFESQWAGEATYLGAAFRSVEMIGHVSQSKRMSNVSVS